MGAVVLGCLANLAPCAAIVAQDSVPPLPRRTTVDSTANRDSLAAARSGWPVAMPDPLPGSIVPAQRIVAFYGNPLSKRMGILGALPRDQMLARLDREVAAWTEADSTTPVKAALHMIAVVAQGSPGRDGKYRTRMDSSLVETVYEWARQHGALLFLDIQIGRSSLRDELDRLAPFLRRPEVHLGIDPEFAMTKGGVPGGKIGSLDARHVNEAIAFLGDLVTAGQLPPKVLVVHRFTRDMLTNAASIRLDPRVQVVINMDGWGPPWMKRESYRRYVQRYPVQFTGFKIFYRNDTRGGSTLMAPGDVLKLFPKPIYIQYQ
jgi:hypothetical protein